MIKFLILGNNNAITYKEVFQHIKNNEMWLGFSANKTMEFQGGDCYDKAYTVDNVTYCKIKSCSWFTNIPHNKNQEPLILTKTYNPIDYPKYDNYDAIEVSKVKDIPIDYDGVMGVPITFLGKYCNSQFEIVDAANRYLLLDHFNVNERVIREHSHCTNINGKPTYFRILIKKNADFEIVGFAGGNSWVNYREVLLGLNFNPNMKYGGGLGVPILNGKAVYERLLIKKNAEFEIIGLLNSSDKKLAGIEETRKYDNFKEIKQNGTFTKSSGKKTKGNPVLKGKPKKGNYYIDQLTNECVFSTYARILIRRKNKRELGQFYTPTLFVDYAHRMLEERFGLDWKEKYVVWDNCCGTKNLTRDYHFGELYCSTLEQGELEISTQYNKEATSFQFDFLNDSLDKLPQGLKDAFAYNKPIIFLINPPYATASIVKGNTKVGVSETNVYAEMKKNNIGRGSQNLYAQFLYRIMMIKEQYGLTNVHIGLFSPTLFLTGSGWKGFRSVFFNHFAFNNGVQFKASHFADVSDNWGISFSIWSNGINADNHNFNYNLIDNVDGEIEIVGSKVIYNVDEIESIRDWAKKDVKKVKTFDAPNMTSGLNIKQEATSVNNPLGKLAENAIGFLFNKSNNVDKNTQDVALFSSAFSDAVGVQILPINFTKCTALFSARRLVNCNWINWADEYLAPNEENENYKEFVNDSIIYSLFDSKSNQSSLRGVEYKGKKWDIKNEFFFMGKDEIMELADEDGMEDCYNDCKASSERYVYGLLKDIELSAEAQAVLDKARELTIKSFKYRKLFNEEHSEYQIMNWDCGWYQIKAVVKEYMPNEYKEFDEAYKKLADKMRPMVYKVGFLK